MAKNIFIPGTSAIRRLTKAVEARIARLKHDFYDCDAFVLSEIEGMIHFAVAGGLLDAEGLDRFVKLVNEKLASWAETHHAEKGLYVISRKDFNS